MGDRLSDERLTEIREHLAKPFTGAGSAAYDLLAEVDMLRVELETLRGIAKRLAYGWVPRKTAEAWVQRLVIPEFLEEMTEAEVHAIYGQKESEG